MAPRQRSDVRVVVRVVSSRSRFSVVFFPDVQSGRSASRRAAVRTTIGRGGAVTCGKE